MFQCEGYHDLLNMDIDKLSNNDTTLKHRKYQGTVKNGKRVYDFLFIPNNGFLNSNLPLVNNSELKISFDRAQLNMAFMAAENVTDMNQIVQLNDVLAITEYISSEELRKYFSKIDTSPLAYKFDEIEITLKSLPMNEIDIRLDNIKGGNNPIVLFMGIIPTAALTGDQVKVWIFYNPQIF